jgi:hypothetical protein
MGTSTPSGMVDDLFLPATASVISSGRDLMVIPSKNARK